MNVLVVWIHLLAAITWIGGMLFISMVVVPVSRRLPPPGGVQLLREVGRYFRWVAWPAIILLVGTGILNAWQDGYLAALFQGTLLERVGGRFLAAKVLLVLLMVLLSFLHDFVLGPQAAARELAARRSDPPGASLLARAARLRKATSWLARLNALLALMVVLLGVLAARG